MNFNNAKIDILLATYNGAEYISQQIDSLLGQTNQDWRLIAHDDGSTDKTVEILKGYQIAHPNKVVILEDGVKCGGAKNNFSHLLVHSSAPYIMFCDQDDVWLKDKVDLTFKRMLDEASRRPGKPILVHTDLMVVDKNLNAIASSMFSYQCLSREIVSLDELVVRNNITGCTMMINREAVDVSLPIPSAAVMHDWWIACRVTQNDGLVVFIDIPTIRYRQHGKNSVGAKKIDLYHYFARVIDVRHSWYSFRNIFLQAKAIDSKFTFFRMVVLKLKSVLFMVRSFV